MTNHQTRPRARRGILAGALALAGLVVTVPVAGASTPATATGKLPVQCAADCTVELYAGASHITLPDGSATGLTIPTWRFAMGAAPADNTGVGGPTIVAAAGVTITINVHNGLLAGELGLGLPQAVSQWSHDNGTTWRSGSDITGVAPGSVATYRIVNAAPGTYLYGAGATPNGKRENAMGLYGALVVEATTGVYGEASTFTDEQVAVLSDLDPALNLSPDPLAFEMNDPNGWNPSWYLVNGQPTASDVPVTGGSTTLVRYVNAGIENHWMGVLGSRQHHVGFDAHALTNVVSGLGQGIDAVIEALPGGSTADDLIAITSTTIDERTVIADQGKDMGLGGLGMALYLQVAGVSSSTTGLCPTAKATVQNLALGSAAAAHWSSGTGVTVTGSALQCLAGGAADTVAWSVDATPASASGSVSGSAAGGAFSISLTDSDLLTILQKESASPSTGWAKLHRIYFQATFSGVAGEVSSISFMLDNVGPDVTRVSLGAPVTNGTAALHFWATGDDSQTGGSDVASFTATVLGTSCAVTQIGVVPAVSVDLQGDIPLADCKTSLTDGQTYTVQITATDALGNTTSTTDATLNDVGTATFLYDATGPTTSFDVDPLKALQQRLPADATHPNGGIAVGWNNGTLGYDINQYYVRAYASAVDTSSHVADVVGAWQDVSSAAQPAMCSALNPAGTRFDFDGVTQVNPLSERRFAYIPLADLNRFISVMAGGISSSTATSITDSGKAGKWSPNLLQNLATPNTIAITSSTVGTDVGKFARITGNTSTGQITFTDGWRRIDNANLEVAALAPAAGAKYGLTLTVKYYARSQDEAGNWGSCASTTEIIDTTKPLVPTLEPAGVTQEGGAIAFRQAGKKLGKASRFILRLSGTENLGADAAAGGALSAAEWFEGSDPGLGKANALNVTGIKGTRYVVKLAAQIDVSRWSSGVHTLSVRVRDMAGNWSPIKKLTVLINFRPLFASGFENGMKGWKASGKVKVTKAAALVGKRGLAVTNGAVTHVDHLAVSAYHASFKLDTNGSTTGGDAQVILAGNNGAASVFTLERKTDATGQYLRVTAHDGSTVKTGDWVLVSDDVHTIAVDWYASKTGEINVKLDGVALTSLTGIDTATQRVDRVSLGATGTAKAAGTLYVDQYASTH